MTTLIMRTASTTYEMNGGDGYLYRFITEGTVGKTMVRRTEVPEEGRPAMWNHGVMCQMQDEDGTWKPSISAGARSSKSYATLSAALEIFPEDVSILQQ